MSNARNFLQTCCSYCALVRFGLLLFCLWCVCNLVAINLLFQKCKTIIHSMEFLLQSHYGNGTGHIDHAHRVTLGSIKSFVSVVIADSPQLYSCPFMFGSCWIFALRLNWLHQTHLQLFLWESLEVNLTLILAQSLSHSTPALCASKYPNNVNWIMVSFSCEC